MLYVANEQVKHRTYDEHIREVEGACFSPLVLSAGGGMGPSATTVYRKLASMLANEWDLSYSRYMSWLCCRLCLSLLRSAIMCIRDHRPWLIDLCISFMKMKKK